MIYRYVNGTAVSTTQPRSTFFSQLYLNHGSKLVSRLLTTTTTNIVLRLLQSRSKAVVHGPHDNILLRQGGGTGIIFVGWSVPWVNTRIRCGNPAGWFLRAKIILAKMEWRAEYKCMTKTIN